MFGFWRLVSKNYQQKEGDPAPAPVPALSHATSRLRENTDIIGKSPFLNMPGPSLVEMKSTSQSTSHNIAGNVTMAVKGIHQAFQPSCAQGLPNISPVESSSSGSQQPQDLNGFIKPLHYSSAPPSSGLLIPPPPSIIRRSTLHATPPLHAASHAQPLRFPKPTTTLIANMTDTQPEQTQGGHTYSQFGSNGRGQRVSGHAVIQGVPQRSVNKVAASGTASNGKASHVTPAAQPRLPRSIKDTAVDVIEIAHGNDDFEIIEAQDPWAGKNKVQYPPCRGISGGEFCNGNPSMVSLEQLSREEMLYVTTRRLMSRTNEVQLKVPNGASSSAHGYTPQSTTRLGEGSKAPKKRKRADPDQAPHATLPNVNSGSQRLGASSYHSEENEQDVPRYRATKRQRKIPIETVEPQQSLQPGLGGSGTLRQGRMGDAPRYGLPAGFFANGNSIQSGTPYKSPYSHSAAQIPSQEIRHVQSSPPSNCPRSSPVVLSRPEIQASSSNQYMSDPPHVSAATHHAPVHNKEIEYLSSQPASNKYISLDGIFSPPSSRHIASPPAARISPLHNPYQQYIDQRYAAQRVNMLGESYDYSPKYQKLLQNLGTWGAHTEWGLERTRGHQLRRIFDERDW